MTDSNDETSKYALTITDEYDAITEVVVVQAANADDARAEFEDFDLYEVAVDTIYDGETMEKVFARSLEVAEELAPKASGEYFDGIGDGNKIERSEFTVTNVQELTGDPDDWSLDEYHADAEFRNRTRIN